MISLLAVLLAVVNTPYAPVSYACDGSTAAFTVNFPYQAQTDLAVTSTTAGGAVTTLVITTDFTLNVSSTQTTATLTLLSPATSCLSGSTLQIARATPKTQPTGFRAQTSFNPAVHETALDREEMQHQELSFKEITDLGVVNNTVAAFNASGAAIGSTTSVLSTGSTTPRTLATRFSEGIVNVKDFGAKGDGITDDTVAIQAAVNSAKTILFPAGTYLVSSAVSSPAQRIFIGEGRANTIIKNGVVNTTILKLVNAGTSRTLDVTIRGIYFQSNPAASTTALDLRGSSYVTLDDVQVIGNVNGINFADANTGLCIDMTLGGASFNGYNRLKNVYTSFCSIGLKAISNVLQIEGGSYDLNSTRGLWVLSSAAVSIIGSDIASNGKGQVTTFSVDRYDRGGLLVETTNGVFISGVYHELNALRESASEFSPNDVEILPTCTRARYFAARADISSAGPIYGQASTYGLEYGSGRGSQYGSEAGLIANGEFRSLTASVPTFWNIINTIVASASSTLPVGVTGQRFTSTTSFSRLWYPIFSAADCTRYAGRTVTLTFWAAPITNPWTSQYLRGGLTPTATGTETGSSFFVLTGSGLSTPQKYSARYKIVGNEPGLSAFFTIGTFATAAVFEIGSVSASLSEAEPYVPEQNIDSSGGRIWNTANAGTITLAAGTGTATVVSGGKCVCTDTTANVSVKCAVSTTTLTATGTGTDVISYICF